MFEIQPRYLAIVRERGFRLPDRYEVFEPQIRELERAMRVRPEETVPCNNDLLAENFIRRRRGDAADRLRVLGNDGLVRARQRLERVEPLARAARGARRAYYVRTLRNKVARARLWGPIWKYGWTLWGSIQDGISTLDFDFWGWAIEKYERAVEELDGPQFEQLLADVQRDD